MAILRTKVMKYEGSEALLCTAPVWKMSAQYKYKKSAEVWTNYADRTERESLKSLIYHVGLIVL